MLNYATIVTPPDSLHPALSSHPKINTTNQLLKVNFIKFNTSSQTSFVSKMSLFHLKTDTSPEILPKVLAPEGTQT